MTTRLGDTVLTTAAAVAIFLFLAVAPWLLPLDRWLPEPSTPATLQGAAFGHDGPLHRLLSPPARETFAAMIERPLFNASRRAPSGAPTPLGSERKLLGRYRLSGVVVTAERRLALLVDASGRHIRVQEGSELDGWHMLSISPRRLVLSRGDERLEHALKTYPGSINDRDN